MNGRDERPTGEGRRVAARVCASRALAAVALLLGALAPAVTPLASAAAASTDAPLQYSVDGVHWSASPPDSLFPGWMPVPGASRTAMLHLLSTRPGETVVAVYAGSASGTDDGLLEATSIASGDAEVSLSALVTGAASSCVPLGAQAVLRSGEALVVPVTFRVSSELTTGRQESVGLDLLVAMSDTGPTVLSNGCPVDPEIIAAFPGAVPSPSPTPDVGAAPAGTLPKSGSDVPESFAVFALLALTVGAALVVGSGRRRAKGDLPAAGRDGAGGAAGGSH